MYCGERSNIKSSDLQSLVRIGDKFGRLEVVDEAEPYIWRGRFNRRRWSCLCICGRTTIVRDDVLRFGRVLSCGCLRDDVTRERVTRHGCRAGGTRTPEYQAWQAMTRVQGETPVCKTWCAPQGEGFRAFLRDVGYRPSPKHRLVRLDKSRPMQRINAAWRTDEPRPGVSRRLVGVDGRLMSLREAACHAGIPYSLLCKRLSRGWPVSRALQVTSKPSVLTTGKTDDPGAPERRESERAQPSLAPMVPT